MRLTEHQRKQILRAVHEVLGESAVVRLFGSRVDDAKRGGDIDLLVETPQVMDSEIKTHGKIMWKFALALGDRKIDLILKDQKTRPQPIFDIAQKTGIVL